MHFGQQMIKYVPSCALLLTDSLLPSWLMLVFQLEIALDQVAVPPVPQQTESECGIFTLEFAFRLLKSIERCDEIPSVGEFRVLIARFFFYYKL